MVDCLIVGHNDGHFPTHVEMVERMGTDSGAFRDLALSYVQWDGTPMRALDIFNRLEVPDARGDTRRYHNFEFLWPTITYLGSFLSRHGLSFDYVNLFQEEKEEFKQKLAEKPLAVAVTTTLYVTPTPVMEVVRFVREHSPETTVVVGGPFVQNYGKQLSKKDLNALFTLLGADVYVDSNEGELALGRVLTALREGRQPRGVPNVIYRDGGEFVFNPKEFESNPLDENMVDYGRFSSLGNFVSLRISKSCPYSCAFCGFPARAGKYVYLSPKQVEAELDRIREHESVTNLTFIDDTCNVPKGRFKKILRMMIDKKYDFRWNCFYRSDHGDQEVIDLMAEAGCEGVFLGVESGSDRMLEAMNKTARRADYLRAIPALKKNGIVTHANLIVGFPGETEETVAETRGLLEEARPDFFRAQLWYADPITPVWERREELGIEGSMFTWSHKTMDADTAIGIVDDLFATVRDPHWLPQTGFELWSVFYLMRRGMNLEQVKRVVGSFNDAVAENIGRSKPAEISEGALAKLREAYRFTPAA
ncbi:PhpK family radical SAM P-methyltransferase [Amycolatopsis sp. NPDC049691]|uniref:PhpK family radical SAM P-methyltransferase n=1 Tax=Amycolatopsis sp. NPDC049691 TaxID=3155155 RepID=UPI0034220F51